MTEIALSWNEDAFAADLLLDGAALATDGGLKSAIILSLFTDAAAATDDILPDDDSDRRGWWGDAVPPHGLEPGRDRFGSKLWLLRRAKILPVTLERARLWATEALQWLIDDGVAAALSVDAVIVAGDALGLQVTVTRSPATGGASLRYDFVWKDM